MYEHRYNRLHKILKAFITHKQSDEVVQNKYNIQITSLHYALSLIITHTNNPIVLFLMCSEAKLCHSIILNNLTD